MRLCASVLAIVVLSPLSAFAQAPADQPPGAAAPAAPPPPMPPPPMEAMPPAPPPVVVAPPATTVAPMAPAPVTANPAGPPAPTWKDLITFSGLADAYYMYNFSGSTSQTPPLPSGMNGIAVRSFDVNSNSFTLNLAKLSVAVAPKPVGVQIDIGYGATGALVNSNAPGLAAASMAGGSPSTLNGATSPFFVEQAYATTSFGNLTLDLGKFTTWAGSEVIEANLNPNYSRSIMFFYIPLVHTGLRAAYQVNGSLAVKAAVVNGWNDLGFEGDANKQKTFGAEIAYTAPDSTAITLNGYFGKEQPAGVGNVRSLIDLVVARTIAALSLNLNIDYIHEKGNITYDDYLGVALMGKYQVSDMFALAARGEYVKFSKVGNTTPHAEEGTLTGIVPLGGRMEIRAELRGDFVSIGGANNFDGGQDKNQFTGTVAFLAWF